MKLETAQQEFTGQVRRIRLSDIQPSAHNPRGPVHDTEASFERLTTSIQTVGLLVPIVVRELSRPKGECKYELVDGERRYWAAKRIGLPSVPAHVLDTQVQTGDLRKLMFHLHMTREQWGPLAQCSSLDEIYPAVQDGIPFDQKDAWVSRLAHDMNMSKVTARDRIHVLSWPSKLKTRIYEFNEEEPAKDIYSYVLALEASIVVPSIEAFPNYYDHGQPKDPRINRLRESLLNKTIDSLSVGALVSREQIREVRPVFSDLPPNRKIAAQRIFENLASEPEYVFQDAISDIEIKLPDALIQRVPKPRSVIAAMKSLTRTFDTYALDVYLDGDPQDSKKKKIRKDFKAALENLLDAARSLNAKLR